MPELNDVLNDDPKQRGLDLMGILKRLQVGEHKSPQTSADENPLFHYSTPQILKTSDLTGAKKLMLSKLST